MTNECPIGLFDSGIGGLTILQELSSRMPHENLVYLADTARFPLGNKPPETIILSAVESAQFLLSQSVKLLIIACFTASSHAYPILQKSLTIPILNVIESGAKKLASSTKTKSVAVLGTTSTIESGALQAEILRIDPTLSIHPIACPLFAPFAEEGLPNHPALFSIASHYLAPLKNTNVDAILLGCTHYPLLTNTLQQVVGPHVQLISPAFSCAQQIEDTLQQKNLQNPTKKKRTIRCFVTANPRKFQSLTQKFLTPSLQKITLAQISTL